MDSKAFSYDMPVNLTYYLNAFFKRKQAEQMFENGIAIKKDM